MTAESPSQPQPIGMSRATASLLWLAVLGAAAPTMLAAFAERLWIGDMVTFFRPQLALACLVALCVAALMRRRLASAALAVLLAVNALPVMTPGLPAAAATPAANLRVVSANLLFDNATPDRFGEALAALSPDIVVTQEARFGWPRTLRALPGFPYMAGPEVLWWNSNIVLSRYPTRARLVADMPPSGGALGGGKALRVEIDVPGRDGPVVLYAIHAPTPRTFAGWQARNRYLDALAGRIAAEPAGTPVILAGDWNTPVWSPAYARTLERAGLEATERSAWPPATRLFARVGGIAVGTPIDHVAVSRGIDVADIFLGPDFGSDHLPVVADLRLP